VKTLFLRKHIQYCFGLFLLLFFLSSTTYAADSKLIVGTKIAPPFSMKNKNNEWEGISVELWKNIASELKLDFEWKQLDLPSLLAGVRDKSLDVGIAAITVTSNRERQFDFSHSYYSTGLTIAIPKKSDSGWTNVIKGIFSLRMLQLIFMLFSILTVVGTIIWLVERNKSEHFNTNNPIKGIASGIWLAAVTMTTVGYGDIAPKSFFGKIVTLIWMFASLLLVSVIIAGVAATLASSKSEALVSGPQDLARARVASIQNSTSDEYLLDRKIEPNYYSSIPKALDAMKNGEVDALVA